MQKIIMSAGLLVSVMVQAGEVEGLGLAGAYGYKNTVKPQSFVNIQALKDALSDQRNLLNQRDAIERELKLSQKNFKIDARMPVQHNNLEVAVWLMRNLQETASQKACFCLLRCYKAQEVDSTFGGTQNNSKFLQVKDGIVTFIPERFDPRNTKVSAGLAGESGLINVIFSDDDHQQTYSFTREGVYQHQSPITPACASEK